MLWLPKYIRIGTIFLRGYLAGFNLLKVEQLITLPQGTRILVICYH